MAAIELLYGEQSWLRIVPAVYTAGQTTQIASLGTKIDILRAIKVTPTFAGATSADSTAKLQIKTRDIGAAFQLKQYSYLKLSR